MNISIIMPAYNAEKYILEAIESVQNQTYSNWELLILDDNSTDDTEKLVQKKILEDKRIFYYKNSKNKGVSYTRNKGINIAKGDWIAFLDSDDVWSKEKLEKQFLLIKNYPQAKLLFTGSAFIDEKSRLLNYTLSVPTEIDYKTLLKQNIISCSSVLVKKEYVCKFNMPNDTMHEDFAVWLQILKEIPIAYGINEPLLLYRLSSNSKSSNKIKAAKMTLKVYQYIGLSIPEIIYYFCCYTIRSLKKYKNINRN